MTRTAKRSYNAPRRAAAAQRTRHTIVAAAKAEFEARGWAGATVRDIAARGRVSPKTVEALFGTKAALLSATVDFSIRGDVRPITLDRRAAFREMEAVSGAAAFLDLHAAQVRRISERTARIAWVVEQAAGSESEIAELWERMAKNRRTGVRWAAKTLNAKHDADFSLSKRDVEDTFWIALDWGTYRTLNDHRGMSADAFQVWLRRYYGSMLRR
jgi:AcrR family transcriptional regulator